MKNKKRKGVQGKEENVATVKTRKEIEDRDRKRVLNCKEM